MFQQWTLAGRKWQAKRCSAEEAQEHNESQYDFTSDAGMCSVTKATCYILEAARESEEFREITLCHEVIHSFLFSLGYADETHDERLVEGLGLCLWQYLKSGKGNINLK